MDEVTNGGGEDQPPPQGCIWKRADKLKPGDQVFTEDGKFRRINHLDTAKWIKTSEGYCVWVFYQGGGDEVAGKSSEFAVKA